MNEEILRSKFIGCLIGCAIGDALGTYAFHRLPKNLLDFKEKERFKYTDDTAMMIGVAEILASKQRIEEKTLGDRFLYNYEKEPERGYAKGPIKIFELVKTTGIPYSKAAQMQFGWQGSFGNGGPMRVAPIGLFFHDSEELYEQAKLSSLITHAHPIAIDGTIVIAKTVAEATKTSKNEVIDAFSFTSSLLSIVQTYEFKKKMEEIIKLIKSNATDKIAADELGRGFRADESVPFAVYSFLVHQNSFKDCLICAVGNGGDRDTLGAMAGSIAGAFHGIQAIPTEWLSRLENKDYLEKLAILLFQRRI